MVKAQFLILFLISNSPSSFSRNSLEAEESFVEFGVYRTTLYDYNPIQASSCWNMIVAKPRNIHAVRPFIGKNICLGDITSCAWLGTTTACASTVGRSKIRWVKAERDGQSYAYGESDNCNAEEGVQLYRSIYDRSVCVCDCFQNNWGIHVGQMQSRERENYVITGIRFILHDHVLYLQPAEGKLGANHTISGHSWIPLPIERSKIRRVDPASVNFFLDDLILDEGYALTGVKFEYMEVTNPKQVKGFGISVSGKPFFNDGKLDARPGGMLTIKPDLTTPRYAASQMPFGLDTMKKSNSRLSRVNYEYVKLYRSTIEADFGESTLPLFRNPFVDNHDVLLSGFGIFHETSPTGEQFLTLRLHPRALN